MTKLKNKDRFIEFRDNLLENIDERFERFVEQVNEKINQLPTREEFFETMDALMNEVKNNREEQTILSHRTSDHEDRITKLEASQI